MNEERSIRAGNLDWMAVWERMRAEAAAAKEGIPHAGVEDRWARRAERFDRRSRAHHAGEALPAVLEAAVRPGDVVIDVGAGTGRHVIPFARRAARVIAVEPSPSMRDRLSARVAEEGLGNVDIVAASWPMIPEGPSADVVFSSHVVYAVDDVPAFLMAMTRASRRLCVLCLGLRAPADALAPLWRRVRGRDVSPRPAALETLNLLYQMGARAEMTLEAGSTRVFAWKSNDEDVAELCHRLSLEPDAGNMALVREALAAEAPANEEGVHVLGTTGPNALICWEGAG